MSEKRGYLDEQTTAGRVIVCEREGRWAVALGRQWGSSFPLAAARSLDQAWQLLAAAPTSFLVIEVTAGVVEPLLERLVRLPRDYPLARAAAVGSPDLAQHYEWLLREAGVVCLVASRRRADVLTHVARRHLDQTPKPPEDVVTRIWNHLPWPRRSESAHD